MPKEPLRIIGINPGTRYMGIAALQGTELMDWGVKNVSGKSPEEKIENAIIILSSLLDQYEPDAIAIKRFHLSRTSPNLNGLIRGIKKLSQGKKINIYEYSIRDLERSLCPGGRISKGDLVEIVASEYPVLFYELNKEKSRKNPYYTRMFEAVALGLVCFHQLDGPR